MFGDLKSCYFVYNSLFINNCILLSCLLLNNIWISLSFLWLLDLSSLSFLSLGSPSFFPLLYFVSGIFLLGIHLCFNVAIFFKGMVFIIELVSGNFLQLMYFLKSWNSNDVLFLNSCLHFLDLLFPVPFSTYPFSNSLHHILLSLFPQSFILFLHCLDKFLFHVFYFPVLPLVFLCSILY